MKKLVIILVLICSGTIAEAQSDSRLVQEQIKTEHLPYLGLIESLAILCATDPSLSTVDAQKFWDITSKKAAAVEWVSERFNDDLIEILAQDYDRDSNKEFYFDQINSHGGCNESLLIELEFEIENVKLNIRSNDPVEVSDAPMWLVFTAFIIPAGLINMLHYLFRLFGGKRD